jgi:hypothetical protein
MTEPLPHGGLLHLTHVRGAYSGMKRIISNIVSFLVSVCMAAMAALTVGYIAHYDLGFSHPDASPYRRRHYRPPISDRVFQKEAAKIQMTSSFF